MLQALQVRGRFDMPSLQPTPFSDAPLTIVLPVLNEAATLAPRLLALQPLRARGALARALKRARSTESGPNAL